MAANAPSQLRVRVKHATTHAAIMGSLCLTPVIVSSIVGTSRGALLVDGEGILLLNRVSKPPLCKPGTTLPRLPMTPFAGTGGSEVTIVGVSGITCAAGTVEVAGIV